MDAAQGILAIPDSHGIVSRVQGTVGTYLSNMMFLQNGVVLDGERYPTVEHAYQASKFQDPRFRKLILGMEGESELGYGKVVKRWTRTIDMPKLGSSEKLFTMKSLVRQKFEGHPGLDALLSGTKGLMIYEVNWWGDRFWGVDRNGVGQNHLGRILMDVRSRNDDPFE